MEDIEVLNKDTISWSSFTEGRISVNCKTKKDNEDFLKECIKIDLKWNRCGDYVTSKDSTLWEKYEKETCYKCTYGGLRYGNIDDYSEEYDICEWEISNKQVKIKPINKNTINWNEFKQSNFIINCATKTLSNDFVKIASSKGIEVDGNWSNKNTTYMCDEADLMEAFQGETVEIEDEDYYFEWETIKDKPSKTKAKDIVKDIVKEDSITPTQNKNNGGNKMNMNGLIKDFGKIEDGSVALTFDGKIAVRVNDSEYIRYNKETKTMENQMDLVIKEASDLIYIMPVNEISVDDIIKHKNSYYQITGVDKNKALTTVNIKDGTGKKIIKETNIMGLSFYYKVISLFSQDGSTNATTNGINPMMLMMLGNDDEDSNSLLPMLMMSGGMNMNTNVSTEEGQVQTQQNGMGGMNPMMLMMMMSKNKDGKGGDSKMKDLMMMQMMSGQMGNSGSQAMNPAMLMMMMSDGEMDMKTLMMMQMMSQNNQSK